ncbi:MAG: cobalt ABC transporter ATP-binding protein [Acidimicrobiia bacterium]
MSAVRFEAVRFGYPDGPDALRDIDLDVAPGDLVLVVGDSGSGKSTLLRTVNGLVPHSSGGRFAGRVVTFGRDTRAHAPRELVDVVGFVAQDPEAQLVVDHVEHDIAFALENLGLPEAVMRRRVEEALDALGIAHLRDRSPSTLSGGERQRAAIAGALAAAPSTLVLDEPTSQLDPQGADDVLAALVRLNADLGTTVLLAEHRLERAAPLAHSAVVLAGGRVAGSGDPRAVLADYPGAPPVTALGRLLGWSPPPLTVREARSRAIAMGGSAGALRDGAAAVDTVNAAAGAGNATADNMNAAAGAAGESLVTVRGLGVELGGRSVLRDVSLEVRAGDVVALLGRNGAGKTTLLRALGGLVQPVRGAMLGSAGVAYVPQNPNSLLFAPTVRDELRETLRLLGRADGGVVDRWLDALGLAPHADRHPRSLSGGERQRVAIGAVAVGGAPVLLLDEPTRGMDAWSRRALHDAILEHARAGGAVVLATHDVELAAECATHAVVLGDGEVVAEGRARDVLAGSLFAPQVLRVLPPHLTVAEVAASLERETLP